MTFKNLAIRSSKEAGKLLLNYFRKLKPGQVNKKSHHEFVTVADIKAEKIILKKIKKYFPGHRILSEEKGRSGQKSDYLWVIDPLDGTSNFTMGNPLFAISIALYYRDKPVLGLINAPFLDEVYFAEKGKGSFMNNKRIKVSNQAKLYDSLLTFCYGHSDKAFSQSIKVLVKLHKKVAKYRQLGSAAVEHAYVACGRTDAIMINETNPWDVGAGALLVREAGGRVTDYQGKEWTLKTKDILSTNGKIHHKILKYIKGV